jgi:glycosyltransferase involved in cell wall biosynthesis
MNSLMWTMGGADRFCVEMIKALARNHRSELFVICEKMPKKFSAEIKDYDVKVFETGLSGINSGKTIRAARGWASVPNLGRKIAKILARVNPEIIDPHNFPDVFYAAYYKAHKNHDVKISWFCHEPYRAFYDSEVFKYSPWSEKLFFSIYSDIFVPLDIKYIRLLVNAIGSNSKYTATLVKKIYGRSSQVVYPGVDTSRFKPVNRELEYSLDCDFLVLSVGRVEFSHKNLQVIPMVLRRIGKRHDIKWVHIGDGTDASKLDRIAKSYGVREHLVFKKEVTENELVQYYSSADVVVYTPLCEPFGLVPLEAMACETPVIASKHGGTSETILNGKTGLLVNMDSIFEITQAILYILENEDVARKMGILGRRRVDSMFTLDKTAKDFCSFVYG